MNLTAAHSSELLWSIVVPLYNKQEFIEQTLASVLRQVGASDFEVVVVDDGSLDQGPDKVLALGDPRVRLIRQSNAGVSAARNCGIRAAHGKWLIFLDADDVLHPYALREYEVMHRRNPASRVLAGAYVRIPNSEVASFEFSPHVVDVRFRLIDDLPNQILKFGMVFSASSIAIEKNLLEQMKDWFPEGESLGEDLDLWLRIAELTPIQFSPNCIALYRVELPSSLSASRIFDRLFPYLQRLELRARNGDIPPRLVGASLALVADARISMARESIRRGRRSEAPALLVTAWRRMRSIRWWFTWLAFLAPAVLRWREQ